MSSGVDCWGPPGTGKTTWIANTVRSTVQARGSDSVAICSLTRTAAKEIAGRGLDVPDGQVGTLHALAYRSIERPTVAIEHVDEWNASHPLFSLSGNGKRRGAMDEPDGSFAGQTEGDQLMAALDVARARLMPEQLMPMKVQNFAKKWGHWKRENGYQDFSDFIETAIQTTDHAPGKPHVLYADEVQDFSPLELKLLRHWARQAEKLIIVGDPNQSLFHFRGATADAFLNPPVPDDQRRVLSQSYRIPRAVHAVATDWITRLSRYEPADYLPRDEDGLVRHSEANLNDPETLLLDAMKQVEAGRSVMIQATCGYMLDPVKHEMKKQGIAFSNPWRITRGDWNPLRGNGRGISSVERVLAYLIMDETMFGEVSRLWTGEDVKRWTHLVKKQGVFRRGATAAISQLPDRELSYAEVASLFDDDETLRRAVTPDLGWLRENLLAGAQPASYPIAVAERSGGQALIDEPRLVLGTVHSLKGSEVDVVFLAPDLSGAGFREWSEGGEARDAIIRCMYVGMTRAKEELVMLQPNGNLSVPVEDLLRGARP